MVLQSGARGSLVGLVLDDAELKKDIRMLVADLNAFWRGGGEMVHDNPMFVPLMRSVLGRSRALM